MANKNYCLYYHGEADNPFAPDDVKSRWWWYESMYFGRVFDTDHEKWESFVPRAKDDIESVAHLMNSQDVSIETKGFLVWSIGTTMGHNPYETFDFFHDYGRGIYPDSLYEPPKEEKDPLKLCHFYKGEAECPFDMNSADSTYWSIEETWVKLVVDDEDRSDKYLVPFLLEFDGGLDGFKIPVTLKATMYEQFTHFGGSKGAFPDFLLSYLSRANQLGL